MEANAHDMPLSRDTLQASGIIVLDRMIEAVEGQRSLDGETIESLEAAKLVDPLVRLLPCTPALAERVRNAVVQATRAGEVAANAYLAKYPGDRDAAGAAVVTTYEILNEAVQCLVGVKLARVAPGGDVTLCLHGQWPIQQSISYSEAICNAAAKVLENELGVRFYVHSFMD